MKPFNLNEALAGHPVVTRDGRKVTQLHLFDVSNPYCLWAVVGGGILSFTREGAYTTFTRESVYDLFMESINPEKWINIYKDRCSGELFVGQKIYNSEQDARSNVWNDMEYFNTIEIEV